MLRHSSSTPSNHQKEWLHPVHLRLANAPIPQAPPPRHPGSDGLSDVVQQPGLVQLLLPLCSHKKKTASFLILCLQKCFNHLFFGSQQAFYIFSILFFLWDVHGKPFHSANKPAIHINRKKRQFSIFVCIKLLLDSPPSNFPFSAIPFKRSQVGHMLPGETGIWGPARPQATAQELPTGPWGAESNDHILCLSEDKPKLQSWSCFQHRNCSFWPWSTVFLGLFSLRPQRLNGWKSAGPLLGILFQCIRPGSVWKI